MESISGYLRFPPNYQFTVNGTPICKFALYDTSQYEGDYTTKHYVVAWREIADLCNELDVNDFVYISGFWKDSSWIDKKSGEPISRREMIAQRVCVKASDGRIIDIAKIFEGDKDANSQ